MPKAKPTYTAGEYSSDTPISREDVARYGSKPAARASKPVRFLAYQQALSLFCGQRMLALDAAEALLDSELDAMENALCIVARVLPRLMHAEHYLGQGDDGRTRLELERLAEGIVERLDKLHVRGF